jgi:hypothetical protein
MFGHKPKLGAPMRQSRRFIKFLISLFFLVGSPAVHSEGVYFGSTISHSEADYGTNLGLSGGAMLDDQGMGFKVIGGYRWKSLVSFEAHYTDFGEVSLLMPNGSSVTRGGLVTTNATGATSGTRVEASSFGVSAMLTIPFEVVRPYLKVGVHAWDTSREVGVGSADVFATQIDGADLLRGIGFDAPINEVFFTRLEYEVYDLDDDKISLLSWGVFLNF